jgi:outer membrane protein assembly factor BamB
MGGRVLIATLIALAAWPVAPAFAQLPPLPPIGPPGGGDPEPERPPSPPPVSRAPGSVTSRVDVAQTGFFADDGLVPPLKRRWRVSFGAETVLAAEGKVFLSKFDQTQAVDQRTGRVVWTAPVRGTKAAYDAGRLFVNAGGGITALDARSGAVLWAKRISDISNPQTPVASGGFVYVVDTQDGDLYAFRASDGSSAWVRQSLQADGAPVVDNNRVYVSDCDATWAHDRRDGAQVWKTSADCVFGATPALHAGRLWTAGSQGLGDEHSSPILDPASGRVLARYPGGSPTFVDGLAVTAHREVALTARNERTLTTAWSLKGDYVPPIAIGHDLYTATKDPSDDRFYLVALDSEDGSVRWSQRFGGFTRSDEGVRFAAAPGLLLVSANGNVTAYESEFAPSAGGIDIGADQFDAFAGTRVGLGGVLGSSLRARRPTVEIDAARWRRGTFRRIGSVRPSRDGGFSGLTRLRRNTRYRARAGGAASRPVTVYAYPRFAFGRARPAGRRIRVSIRVKAPGARFGGRRLFLYFDRRGDNKGLRRLAGGRLRGRANARAILRFRPLRRAGRRDTVVACVRGQARMGLGRPTPLVRRCGARRLRVG